MSGPPKQRTGEEREELRITFRISDAPALVMTGAAAGRYPVAMKRLVLAIVLVLSLAATARAEYPEKPIRLVVPFPPGGVTDLVARQLAERLAADLGQPVMVDNKTGAGGVIATDIVAKAPADGYTLLLTTPNHTINAAFRASLPYDTEKDLRPVAVVGQVPMLLVSHPSLPVRTFKEFVEYARKNPGKVNVSNAGNGTLPHITMELMMLRLQFQVTNVPYRGAMPALQDLVAGQVQAKLDNYTQSAQLIAQGKLNLLAVTSDARLKQFPEVPTIAETLPGFEGYLWMGVVAPAATPEPIVAKLAAAIKRFVDLPETRARFDRDGIEPGDDGPDQFRTIVGLEIKQWREIARASKITVD